MSESTNSGSILLIEDNDAFAASIQRTLEGEGFEVIHCDDGEVGLETALDVVDLRVLQRHLGPRLAAGDTLEIDDAVLHRTAVADDDEGLLARATAHVLVLGRKHRSHLDRTLVHDLAGDGPSIGTSSR